MRSRSRVAVLGVSLFLLASGAVWRSAHSAEQLLTPNDPTARFRAFDVPFPSSAPERDPNSLKCWDSPVMNNILEIVQSQTAPWFGSADASPFENSILALSSGDTDAAFSAGLLVGWGQTGTRPPFSVVSGVGASALIAPFAFLGEKGDQSIGDLFTCGTASFKDLASRAAAKLDEAALAAIASGHKAGRRLYLTAPSSDDHPAVVWNAGLIASSRDPNALAHLRRILAAVVDRKGFLDPKQIPIPAGVVAAEDEGVRLTGAGGWFFIPQEAAPAASQQQPHYFLINNGKLASGENRAFMEFVGEKYTGQQKTTSNTIMTTSFSVFSRARRDGRPFHFACVPPSTPMTSRYGDEIDFQYSHQMFMRSWKAGHTGGGWQTHLPGMER